MSHHLSGKLALVTGASRGLGRAMALALAADGATIAAHYGRSHAEAQSLIKEIEAAGGHAFTVQADLAAADGATELVKAFDQELGKRGLPERLDILVNNAGIVHPIGFAETTPEMFDEIVNVNVRSVFFLTQKLLPRMGEGGRIINVSSAVTRTYFAGVMAYSMLKGPIDVFTHHLAAEVGARGITVNAVAPGAIDTDMNGWLKTDDGVKMIHGLQALQRVGKAEDIAGVVRFLASPGSAWVTGQIIDASGGTKL